MGCKQSGCLNPQKVAPDAVQIISVKVSGYISDGWQAVKSDGNVLGYEDDMFQKNSDQLLQARIDEINNNRQKKAEKKLDDQERKMKKSQSKKELKLEN